MAWTPPATAAVGTLDTAALWNTNVRDNLLWLSRPPSCHVSALGTNQSIPNAVNTAVTWNTEDYDTSAMHSTTTNPTRITVPVAGLYAVTANIWWNVSATGTRQILLYLNGATYALYNQSPGQTTSTVSAFYDEIRCHSGDYLEIFVEQNSGAALTINFNAADAAYASVRWVTS